MVGSWALPLLWILCPWCLRMSSLYGGCKVSSWLKAFWTSVDQVLFPRYTVGRLRPHYLTLCKPDYGPDGPCRDEWNYNRWLFPVPCITKGYFRFVVEEEQTVCLGLLNGETTQSQLHEARYVSTIDVQLACQNVARKTPIPQKWLDLSFSGCLSSRVTPRSRSTAPPTWSSTSKLASATSPSPPTTRPWRPFIECSRWDSVPSFDFNLSFRCSVLSFSLAW